MQMGFVFFESEQLEGENGVVPKKCDTYLEWGDYYVAWPLSVPSEYPDWMLVTFEHDSQTGRVTLVPVRALSPEEVSHIRRRLITYWGMKVPNSEWSLVMWRPSAFQSNGNATVSGASDASRAIGV